jgi:hypothetical protein
MKIKEITEGILDKVADKVAGQAIPNPGEDRANPYGAFAQQIDKNTYGSFSQQLAKTIRGAGGGNPYTQYLKYEEPEDKYAEQKFLDALTDEEREAIRIWKAENPKNSLKYQRKLFRKGQIKEYPWTKYLQPQPDADTSTDNEQPNTQQPRQQQQRQQQTRPQGNPNQNINTKIDYLKSIGVLQSARITDSEKQYIESTDVWVDSNKLQDMDPSTTFFQTRAPHHHMFLRQIVVPGRDLGYDNNVNYQYSLTPAGWWSPMHNGYINPNSKLGQLVDNWAESH